MTSPDLGDENEDEDGTDRSDLDVVPLGSRDAVRGDAFCTGLGFDLLVGLLGRERLETFEALLVGTVAVCSGLIAWYEFRANNTEETEYGEWTGKAALYSTIFGITLFLSFLFVPVVFFDP